MGVTNLGIKYIFQLNTYVKTIMIVNDKQGLLGSNIFSPKYGNPEP